MGRIGRFIKSIGRDARIGAPKEVAGLTIIGIGIGCVVMVPVAVVAAFFSVLSGEPFGERAVNASIAFWAVLFCLVWVFGYLRRKWRESGK